MNQRISIRSYSNDRITIDEKVLIQNFGEIIEEIKSHIIDLEGPISVHHELYKTHLTDDFEELKRNFQFYEQLSIEWLEFRKENKSQSHHMFSNSLTPYFSNNIIPAISHLREDVINQQIQENSKLDIQLRGRAEYFHYSNNHCTNFSIIRGCFIYL